jgi:ferredoxin
LLVIHFDKNPLGDFSVNWFFIMTGLIFSCAVLGFAVTSFLEFEKRASFLTLAFVMVFALSWYGIGLAFPAVTLYLAVAAWTFIALGAFLLALPVGKAEPLKTDFSKTERFDERHIIFGRAELRKGMVQYEEYYAHLNPKMKKTDDALRRMPELGAPGARYYHQLDSPYMVSVFEFIEGYRHLAEPGQPEVTPIEITPQEATRRIKGFAQHLGVLDVRVTRLRDYHVYTHSGRHLHNWGEKIQIDHPYAVVFSVEMDYHMVHNAPLPPASTETAIEYMRIANIAICIAAYIKNIGYKARAHIDGNYQVLATAVAHDAGLGELGRLGLIITPSHGPRVRTAVVTTDIPLIEDQPVNFGVQHFCEICKKCAENCPSQSIDSGEKKEIRGTMKWQSKMESCYKFWRSVGTDCSICLAVCPYSKPNTFYHKILRFFIHRNPLARKLAFIMDVLAYGKRPRHVFKPNWFSNE